MGFDLPKRIWANEYVRLCFIAIGIMIGFLVRKTNQLQFFPSFLSWLNFCSDLWNNAREDHQEKLFWWHSKWWRKMRKWRKIRVRNGFGFVFNILVRNPCKRFVKRMKIVKCFVRQKRKTWKNFQGPSQISTVTFPQLILFSIKS